MDPKEDLARRRLNRKLCNRRMRTYRSVPVKRRVWYVTLTEVSADLNQFGKHDLPNGLSFEPQAFWCKSRRKARAMVRTDREAGGSGAMFPVEYRLCPNCGRVLLGPAAAEYRVKWRMPPRMWHYADGPACSLDCRPNGRGVNGVRVQYNRKDKAA